MSNSEPMAQPVQTLKVNSERDNTLDYIKAFGCLLMMVAHLGIINPADDIAYLSVFICGIAPYFFFAVTGITAAFQAKRYNTKGVLITYLLIGVIGLSFNGQLPHLLLNLYAWEILQIIAFGGIFVFLLQKYAKPCNYIFLIVALLIVAVKFIADKFNIHDIFFGVLFTPMDVYGDGMDALKYPGFPIFPWLYIFPLGVFCYNCKNWMNGVSALILALTLLAYSIVLSDIEIFKKWDMSLAYFLFATSAQFLMFYIFRSMRCKGLILTKPIVFLGRNSLMFLFVHITALFITKAITGQLHNQYISWIVAFILSILFVWLGSCAPSLEIFSKKKAWVVFMAFVVFVPMALKFTANEFFNGDDQIIIFASLLNWVIMLFIGVIFAGNYALAAQLFKQA